MANSLQKRIALLEATVSALNSHIQDLVSIVDALTPSPTDKTGDLKNKIFTRPGSINENIQNRMGAPVIWNTSEMAFVSRISMPVDPTTVDGAIGFNKHTHSRFSGGALLVDGVELLEYDYTKNDKGESISEINRIKNIHSQEFWTYQPALKTDINSKGETVKRTGKVAFIFNPDSLLWGVAALEIDVKKVNLVRRGDDGNILLDSGGAPMSSPLYSDNPTKTSVVWDASAKCWRFYAVYAPDTSQI